MDKTININISGTLFQINEEAYQILRDYLQTINNRFRNVRGGMETIEDIESRIAEIFQSQKGMNGIISKENVEAMISIIGKPEDFDQNDPEIEPPVYTSQRKRMYRNPDDSIISGVCGGIGAYLNTDPVLFRILFVLFTIFFGIGFFIYIALWIALPSANTDTQKREMYGNTYHSASGRRNQTVATYNTDSPSYATEYDNSSRLGNAFNEIFRAIGKVLYIFLRILLIIIGISFVLAGFLSIVSFIMVFIFKYPGAFSTDALDVNLAYFPDFLNYIVNPAVTSWIIALTLIALILPMLAFIYWGVKMIFWFKVKDGIFNLVALVLWVVTLTILAIILFNEGISFAETARSSSQIIMSNTPHTLYVLTDHKISDLDPEKEITLDEDYSVFINEQKKELYIRPFLEINSDDVSSVKVKKRSSGRTESDAKKKAEELQYNFRINGDTLMLDEYFVVPAGRRWAGDNMHIDIYVPEGTILRFDKCTESLLHSHYYHEDDECFDSLGSESRYRSWILTNKGLKLKGKHSSN